MIKDLIKLTISIILGLSLLNTQVSAWSQPKEGPKLCLYDVRPNQIYWQDDSFQIEEQDVVKKYDMICSTFHWWIADKCKENNPNVIQLYNVTFGGISPNILYDWQYPDTLYNMNTLFRYYAEKNMARGSDWFYKRTDGSYVPLIYGVRYLNFTSYSPVGKYGTSVNYNVPSWITNKAMPKLIKEPLFKNNWDGIIFDTYPDVDCWNSSWMNVDYNYDHVRDDNYRSWCGKDAIQNRHPWTLQKTSNMNILLNKLLQLSPERFLILYGQDRIFTNAGKHVNGWKLENWGFQPGSLNPGSRWINDWTGEYGTGYLEAEQRFTRYPSIAKYDSLQGWDMSILHMWMPYGWSIDKKLRMARYGLGTAMLGDGFFAVCDSWANGSPKYFEIPEMTEWKVDLPALSEMYEMPDPSHNGVKRFCRLYRGYNQFNKPFPCTVVVDTLNQDAYFFRYNYAPGRKTTQNTKLY